MIASVLAHVSIFEHLRPDEIDRVARHFTTESLAKGDARSYGATEDDARMVVLVTGLARLELTSGTNPSHSENTGCYLIAPDSSNIDAAYLSTSITGGYPTQETLSLMGPLTTSGGNVTEVCYSDDTSLSGFAYQSRIVAIKVGSVTGTAKRHAGRFAPTPAGATG